jgi:dihydroorotate dehydrogenase
MSWLYRQLIRPLLFSQDSESIHNRTLACLGIISSAPSLRRGLYEFFGSPSLPVECLGLRFPNPMGLAAGMDKNGVAFPAWASLGFGFCEIGGVTWHAQPGNPSPRMFRIVPDGALINRMGFNNAGAAALASTLAAWRNEGAWPSHPVGINLGKSKVTPLESAPSDYAKSLEVLWTQADFFVVNVSSPNTPNLRMLQEGSALDEILVALDDVNKRIALQERQLPKAILIKVAPDLDWKALDVMLQVAMTRGAAGIVATNTTVERPANPDPSGYSVYQETGGLSGLPLRERSTTMIRHIYRQTRGRLPVVGVGGIFTVDDAWEKVLSGATLLQAYTGLVFEGPGLAKSIVHGLKERMTGATWDEVVGSGSD